MTETQLKEETEAAEETTDEATSAVVPAANGAGEHGNVVVEEENKYESEAICELSEPRGEEEGKAVSEEDIASQERSGPSIEREEEEEVDFESMKVNELRRELKARDLPTNGRKPDLVQRLRNHLARERAPIAVEEDGEEQLPTDAIDAEQEESEGNKELKEATKQVRDEAKPEEYRDKMGDDGQEEPTVEVNERVEEATGAADKVESEDESSDTEEEEEEADLERMTVAELKQELKKRGLVTTGRKLDLIKRLRDLHVHRAPDREEPSAGQASGRGGRLRTEQGGGFVPRRAWGRKEQSRTLPVAGPHTQDEGSEGRIRRGTEGRSLACHARDRGPRT